MSHAATRRMQRAGSRCLVPPRAVSPPSACCRPLRHSFMRSAMKFFADTADTNDIRELAEAGLLDGVTTNPSLIHKAGRDFLEVVAEICKIVPGMPVSAE